MTVIRPSSISGINSITANGGDINLFRVDGTKADIPIVNNITAGVVTATTFKGAIDATTGTFSGNLGIGGTLTYEDVTNIDSVGVITARSGGYLDIRTGSSINTNATGSAASGTIHKNTNSGEFAVVSGGTGGNNHLTFYTSASAAPTEKLRIKSDGDLLTQGLTSASFDNDGSNTMMYELTGSGTAGKYSVLNLSGNSNTDGGQVSVLRFVNRENANSSSGGNSQSKSLVELDVRSSTSDSNAGDDSGGYMRFITKSEEGQMGERFVLTARGSFKSNGRHNLGGIREITSGTLANGESVSWNGSGTTYTNGSLNWNSIGGNAGSWIGSLSVSAADQNPSGAMVLVGCHGAGFNTYNMLVNQFDSGISVTPTGTGASGNFWNSVITNSSGDTIYYRMLVYHLGTSSETVNGL